MNEYQKKLILNHTITIIMETVWAMLIIVGVLVLVAEDQTACAVLAGIGLLANIIMIVNEVNVLRIWLDSVVEDSENKETEDNK